MELASTAFMMLTQAAPAALSTAASTVGSVGSAVAGAGSSALTAMQGTASLGSSIASILSGAGGLVTGINSARFQDINARSAELESEARAIEIQKDLVRKIGENRVAAAAGGLSISSVDAVEQGLRGQADFETQMALTSGDMASRSRRSQADATRLGGYLSLAGGLSKAAKSYASTKLDIARRGGGDGGWVTTMTEG